VKTKSAARPLGRPRKATLTPGSYYARNHAAILAGVKARQARLGDAYREANRAQMRRNRRRRQDAGQFFLNLYDHELREFTQSRISAA
jgi:hypothetical protein